MTDLRFSLIAATVALCAAPVRASDVRDELKVLRARSTPENPRAGSLTESIDAHIDLSEPLTLTLGGALTFQGQTPEAGSFGTSGGVVPQLTAGLDYDLTEHWNVGATVDLSPSTTQRTGTEVTIAVVNLRPVTADALLRSDSSQAALGADVTYDTAGESELELQVTGGITVNRFDSVQNIEEVQTAAGIVDDSQLRTYCTTHRCPRALLAALRKTPARLDSERFSVAGTATFSADTDVSLGLDLWHYEQDPADLGYFTVISSGRTVNTGGNGIQIAPLQWLVRPEVTHRFGDLSVKLWGERGRYVEGMGQTTAGAGLKLQYRFNRAWRTWVSAGGQSDTDNQGVSSASSSFAAGAAYRF